MKNAFTLLARVPARGTDPPGRPPCWETLTTGTKSAAPRSTTFCDTDGCRTGSKQHWILPQFVAASSQAVSSQSPHGGTQAAGSRGITATAAAPGAASLAKGELKDPGRGAPELTLIGPGKTPGLRLKLEQETLWKEKLLFLCCLRTPKQYPPDGA